MKTKTTKKNTTKNKKQSKGDKVSYDNFVTYSKQKLIDNRCNAYEYVL